MQGISWLAEDLLASQEGLCSTELVILEDYPFVISSTNEPFSFIY